MDSPLSTNILVIALNIVMLKRLLKDIKGLTMFSNEPFLPENGWTDRNWQLDFLPTLHVQDELGPFSTTGNILFTNIHRFFFNEDSGGIFGT